MPSNLDHWKSLPRHPLHEQKLKKITEWFVLPFKSEQIIHGKWVKYSGLFDTLVLSLNSFPLNITPVKEKVLKLWGVGGLLGHAVGDPPTRKGGRQNKAEGEAAVLLQRKPQLILWGLWSRHSPSELGQIEAMQGLGSFTPCISLSVVASCPLGRMQPWTMRFPEASGNAQWEAQLWVPSNQYSQELGLRAFT